jgi:hypothetical protein
MHTQMESTDEFLGRFGDVIDDRVADIIDEILDERQASPSRWRPRPDLAALGLVVAVIASVVLRHSVLAVCTVWLCTAVVCLAVGWTTGPRRP